MFIVINSVTGAKTPKKLFEVIAMAKPNPTDVSVAEAVAQEIIQIAGYLSQDIAVDIRTDYRRQIQRNLDLLKCWMPIEVGHRVGALLLAAQVKILTATRGPLFEAIMGMANALSSRKEPLDERLAPAFLHNLIRGKLFQFPSETKDISGRWRRVQITDRLGLMAIMGCPGAIYKGEPADYKVVPFGVPNVKVFEVIKINGEKS